MLRVNLDTQHEHPAEAVVVATEIEPMTFRQRFIDLTTGKPLTGSNSATPYLLLHPEPQPAEWWHYSTAWVRDGYLHREGDLPAVIRLQDGAAFWYDNGFLHRLGGPAVVTPDGENEWYWYGELIRPNMYGLLDVLTAEELDDKDAIRLLERIVDSPVAVRAQAAAILARHPSTHVSPKVRIYASLLA